MGIKTESDSVKDPMIYQKSTTAKRCKITSSHTSENTVKVKVLNVSEYNGYVSEYKRE